MSTAIEPIVSALPSPAVDFTRRHIGPFAPRNPREA